MLDEEILELRRKLDESIAKENRKIGLVRYQKSPNMLKNLRKYK